MNRKLSPRKIELIETIIDCPYGVSQVTLAEHMGVTPGRINHMIRDLKKLGKKSILSYAA